MLTLCVTFADGDTITTRFNGTEAEAGAYYAPGKLFNGASLLHSSAHRSDGVLCSRNHCSISKLFACCCVIDLISFLLLGPEIFHR